MKNAKRLTTLIGLLVAGTALADSQVDAGKSEPIDDATNLTDVIAADGHAAQTCSSAAGADMKSATSEAVPVYVPPRRGAPKTRVGGGTRSTGSNVQLALLAPEHTGLTSRPSPTLYWWLSQAHDGLFEFVVIAEGEVAPVLRFRQQARLSAGIHALDLEAAGLTLEPGVAYRWSVAIIRDEAHRARDLVALATLEYVPDRSVAGSADALAAAGLWYDALAAVSAADNDSARAELLEQVSLDQVAHWSRTGS